MNQDKLTYLKRAIKRTYKRYTGERTDVKASLKDVTDFFNIPINEERIDDYVIKNIDYDTPNIEVLDTKENISYTATYTGDAHLLNYFGPIQFNSVVSTSPVRKEEILYYIGNETPIITKITFTDDEYELAFEKEMANSVGVFVNDGVRTAVRYLQNVVYDGQNLKQPLFNRIYENSYRNKEIEIFEQVYTYGLNHFINWDGSQDKYSYVKNNNVIYGINELEQKALCNKFCCICFENTAVPKRKDYFPFNMNAEDYPLLNKDNTNSAMIFKVITEDGIRHSLQLYKSNEVISVIYNAKKHCYEGESCVETISDKGYTLPNLSDGTISSEEIKNILSSLPKELGDNTIFDIISNELNEFGTKIDIRKELIQETLDPLSPKLLIDKTNDEICNMIGQNKETYFKLIRDQFDSATNITKTIESNKSLTKKLGSN